MSTEGLHVQGLLRLACSLCADSQETAEAGWEQVEEPAL